jgi:hypothetical protein
MNFHARTWRTRPIRPPQFSPVNFFWSSPAQSYLISVLVETHNCIFVLSRFLHVSKWGRLVDERRGPTATGLAFSLLLSLTLTPHIHLHSRPSQRHFQLYILAPSVSRLSRQNVGTSTSQKRMCLCDRDELLSFSFRSAERAPVYVCMYVCIYALPEWHE